MLGPARFKHIETCTREVCRAFRTYEEVQSVIEQLEKMDSELVRLRSLLASLKSSSSPSSEPSSSQQQDADTEHDEDKQKPILESSSSPISTPTPTQNQNYVKLLLTPPDLAKAKRLLTARTNAVKIVRAHIDNARHHQLKRAHH